MRTDDLIAELTTGLQPVRPIEPPGKRLLIWLAMAVPYLAVIVAVDGLSQELVQRLAEPRFLLEQGAALATALLAAHAALSLSIPGRPAWPSLLPLLSLSVWLGSLGNGCWQAWMQSGGGLALENDWGCIPSIALGSLVPAAALVFMLRRGLVFAPKLTLLMASLASAGLAELALRLHHPVDSSPVVLVWHGGIVFALALLGRTLGPWLLKK
ncbi:MAG: DUF1109 domain-containing protein [Rhodospirillales bacterium]|nr:MAG: DUF1109 domain-containing protein [Rhodospirillales bacterium]